MPHTTSPFGGGCAKGFVKWNARISLARKMKISPRAKDSPGQTRLPTPKGVRTSFLISFPESLMKRLGLKSSGFLW